MTRTSSTIVTLRVTSELDRAIAREARRRRRTRSALVRETLEAAFGEAGTGRDMAAEARRQSIRVSRRASEGDALDYVLHAADSSGWR